MARRMSDDEIEDYTYNKLFGDLDDIESGSMFSSDKSATQGAAPNAGTPGIEGISLTLKPIMAAAAESGRDPEGGKPAPETENDDDDKLKGIGKMSPLMERLHGGR